MVHQHFMLIPVFTVAENVVMGHEPVRGGGLINLAQARATVREISDRFGFDVDPDALVEDLPVGVQQRVEIIKALSREAKILILDEPTAGLDPKQILEIRGLITELGRDHTVILSSHILPEVSAVCRRVLIINRGKIVADGAPETLAKRLLGSSHIMMRLDAGGGGEAAVSTALNRVPAIRRIEFRESQEPGTVELVAEAEGDADIRRDLFHALAGAGIPILMTRSLDLSLEEIFLNLTTTEPAGTGPAAAAGNAGKEND